MSRVGALGVSLIVIPYTQYCMKCAIETKVINTTEQIGSLVDWLVFRHAPPVPYSRTMYIDLEGSDLCCEGSLSILTLLIDTGIPTRRVYLGCSGRTNVRYFRFQTEDAKGYPSGREDPKGLL